MISENYTNILIEYFSCNHSMWTLRQNKAANVTEKKTVHLTWLKKTKEEHHTCSMC